MSLHDYLTNLKETLELLTQNPQFRGAEFDAARLAVNRDLQQLQNSKAAKAKIA